MMSPHDGQYSMHGLEPAKSHTFAILDPFWNWCAEAPVLAVFPWNNLTLTFRRYYYVY